MLIALGVVTPAWAQSDGGMSDGIAPSAGPRAVADAAVEGRTDAAFDAGVRSSERDAAIVSAGRPELDGRAPPAESSKVGADADAPPVSSTEPEGSNVGPASKSGPRPPPPAALEYPPPDVAPELARPAGPALSRPAGPERRRRVVDDEDEDDEEEPPPVRTKPDAGVRDGGTVADFVGPPAKEPSGEQEEGVRELIARIVKTQWSLLRVLLFAFIVFRIAAWFVRRAARANHQLALVLSRLWVFVEATGWAVIAVWIFTRLSQTESTVTAALAGVVVLALIALSWGAIKDVIAGLMISAERPFGVGDYVRVEDAAGQVKSFRTRVLELETDDGHVIRVPYRDVGGATDVRSGGRRTAHAVSVRLELWDSLDANEALEIARELAASSPWSVLGATPKLRVDVDRGAPSIVMEAYAFDREAGPLLYADLLSGWREAQRKS